MQIVAKFAGTCPSCGGGYAEGAEVEWERGAKARHVKCPESRPLRLIEGTGAPSTVMSNAARPVPLFPVSAPSSRSPEENVRAIESLAHVCEVKAPYALVHASPSGVAKIAELGLEVFHSKRGGEYYAVRIARSGVMVVPSAPASAPQVRETPVVSRPAPALEPGVVRLDIRGTEYIVRETRTKRNIDVRRFEVRKDQGDVITEPYVVSFQDHEGRSGGCSCPDWIYRRGQKGDCKHIHGVRNALMKPRQATIPLSIAN